MQQNVLEHNAQINNFKFKTSCKSHKPEPLSFAQSSMQLSVQKETEQERKSKKKKKKTCIEKT